MNEIVKYEQVKDRVIILRGEPVLLDADVAALYGVETRVVNQAVKNNPEKFPKGYLFKLDKQEIANLRSKILISSAESAANEQDADLRSKKRPQVGAVIAMHPPLLRSEDSICWLRF